MNKLILFFQFFKKLKKFLFLFIALFNLGSIFSYIYFFFKLIGCFKSLGFFSKLNFINNLNDILILLRSDEEDMQAKFEKKKLVDIFLKQYALEHPYANIVLNIMIKI